MNTEKFPLAVHFIWHPDDKEQVDEIIQKIQDCLIKKNSNFFSGCHDFPFFFYSSFNDDEIPSQTEYDWAEHNLIFVFCSASLKASKTWEKITSIKNGKGKHIVPVALNPKGLNALKNMPSVNAIRIYDFPKNEIEYAVLAMCHEIHRILNPYKGKIGKNSSIEIFLSHTKNDSFGVTMVESLKSIIDKTNISRFFDVTEICPGYKFDSEIAGHIKKSTVLSVLTDNYSSRYWCQRELLLAKSENRPILVVDALKFRDDRIFPAIANVPCLHITPDEGVPEKKLLEILCATMVESVRCAYLEQIMKFYQGQKWIGKGYKIKIRPPEIYSLDIKKDCKICYPEPCLYKDEVEWLKDYNVEAITPYYIKNKLDGKTIGISISDPVSKDEESYQKLHLPLSAIKKFSQVLARQILLNGGNLAYGGDFRKDGFTDIILNEIHGLANKVKGKNIRLINYRAWPLYNGKTDKEWMADNKDILKIHDVKCSKIPNSLEKKFIKVADAQSKAYWSQSMTNMRKRNVNECGYRICAGGKLRGYSSCMPGVLEEFLLTYKKEKPIFLIGAFGGVAGKICHAIIESQVPEELTYEWQKNNNLYYEDVQKILGKDCANYEEVERILLNVKIDDLAEKTGLLKKEYERLMVTPFIDEAVHLILKGLSNI